MVIAYTRVYSIGGHTHKVELYSKYVQDKGCLDLMETHQYFNTKSIIKAVRPKVTADQLSKLRNSMKFKSDIIIDEHGMYHNY